MLHIDESFLDRTIRVPVGQVVELRLPENPTTGFRWSFTADGAPVCAVVAEGYERPPGPPGAGGEHAWQIKALRTGICHLELRYRRSFEPAAPAARAFALDLEVTE